tara:strand:- start:3634 stop:3831 length:198 start_codon:yes stop_codon:yes gene_type:complete
MNKKNKKSKEIMERVEKWMDLKKRALHLFGKDSVEYIFAESRLDFLLKENDLEIHQLIIGFVKKK